MSELQNIPYNLNSKKKKNRSPDNMFLGLLIGLVFPITGVIILYFLWGNNSGLASYFGMFFDIHNSSKVNAASKVISISMFTNLIPFYYFINRKKYQTARGIILSMFFYAILILLYKFVWS